MAMITHFSFHTCFVSDHSVLMHRASSICALFQSGSWPWPYALCWVPSTSNLREIFWWLCSFTANFIKIHWKLFRLVWLQIDTSTHKGKNITSFSLAGRGNIKQVHITLSGILSSLLCFQSSVSMPSYGPNIVRFWITFFVNTPYTSSVPARSSSLRMFSWCGRLRRARDGMCRSLTGISSPWTQQGGATSSSQSSHPNTVTMAVQQAHDAIEYIYVMDYPVKEL